VVRPSTIIIVVLVLLVCGAGAWLVMGPRVSSPPQSDVSRGSDFFKPPQDYKTTGGQQMKPRW
jgi:Ti type entry exclusion protein TrbK